MSETTSSTPQRKRVLSGMRPTGKLHLGNYMGALKNWVDLQDELDEHGQPKYDCYFFIADYHALTTDYGDTSRIKQNTLDVALDFLAAGLDPEKSTIFIQSHVPQHAELHLLLSMITPLSWLERVPSYKDQQEQLREKDLATYGFLGYPLLQAADILVYQPDFVPVGEDQVAHVELTREVARRFNSTFGVDKFGSRILAAKAATDKILPEPEVLLTPSPKLPGLDGRKMSKSYNNTILLTDNPLVVTQKLQGMSTGGQRVMQSDPGNPNLCPVGDLHRIFSSTTVDSEIREGCRKATTPCAICKMKAARSIFDHLGPLQSRRSRFDMDVESVWGTLIEGSRKAGTRAGQTMELVRAAAGLSRDSSTLQRHSMLERQFRQLGVQHNLQNYKQWWEHTPLLRSREVRDYWLRRIVPPDIALHQIDDQVFVTPHKKRVFLANALENMTNTWRFSSKPKSYELLALLCLDNEHMIHDFLVPQKVFVESWTQSKRKGKNKPIEFAIHKLGDEFVLFFPETGDIPITEFKGNYSPLK